ncbi:hypothetical protein SOV_51820 [Sporomusa ovata DSM 2662]|uniref:Uncharacterized protein n=1 Tax=Sporomusa ovata TaxID=2378 RepID=A0A0U1L140_9FIRM|nr:hypothetical protein [Sporomusa ovata]EQB27554.1 hypothetical protein SOV_2c04510 [Sporomusa ovata DSM 2662]CQR73400.1 hypothetical protein SpAn4DRAFT_2632 [Sporomusa ovata]
MNKTYYGFFISANQLLTPEGYLITYNVPIARIGTHTYCGSKIGINIDR